MKILIVEDEIKLAASINKGLSSAGFVCTEIHDGKVAETHILHNAMEYDMIVLDIMLPHRTGFEICESIRKQGINIPILFLTAMSETEDKIKGFDLGADDYLPKPFDFEELIARCKALLRRSPVLSPNKVEYKDITIDFAGRVVEYKGIDVHVTKIEFNILTYLLRNAGIAKTREQIINAVYDNEDAPVEQIIDSHVKNLRKKIDPTGEEIIISVRGIGYKVNVLTK
jgi:DNA-binding response OmpR family regulator